MGRGFALLFGAVLGLSAVAACVATSFEPDGTVSDVEGGTLTPAALELTPQSPPPPPFDYGPLTPGNTWTALYADYFGPPQPVDGGGQTGGRASCAGPGDCHGTVKGAGAEFTGFVCADKDGCYLSLTCQDGDASASCPKPLKQVLVTSGAPFTDDYLYAHTLRIANRAGGLMPALPPPGYPSAYVFTDFDVQRLSAWVDAGFPND